METITAYKASDGQIFSTEENCLEYEAALKWRDQIEAFRKSPLNPYPNGAQSSMMGRAIVAWESFKASNAA